MPQRPQTYSEYVEDMNITKTNILPNLEIKKIVDDLDEEDIELKNAYYSDTAPNDMDALITEAIRRGGVVYRGTSLLLQSKAYSHLKDATKQNTETNDKLDSIASAMKYMVGLNLLNLAATTNDKSLAKRPR